jgi:hypothetical protein
LKYLNIAEGKTILSGTTSNPYEKSAWLGQAQEQKGLQASQIQAYMDALKGTREGAWKYATEEPIIKMQVDNAARQTLIQAGLEGEGFSKAWSLYQQGTPIDDILAMVKNKNIIEKNLFGGGKAGLEIPTQIPSQGIKTGR